MRGVHGTLGNSKLIIFFDHELHFNLFARYLSTKCVKNIVNVNIKMYKCE